MLTIKAEAQAGTDLREQMLPQMAALAKTTGCAVECEGNGTTFIAYPADTVAALQDAYDRLYPDSGMVMTALQLPLTRDPYASRYQVRDVGPGEGQPERFRVRDTHRNKYLPGRHASREIAQATADASNAGS